jgi:hypothetical protein
MTPNVQKFLLSVLGGALVAAPSAFPVLAPFSALFIGIGGALGGGAWIPRPGDVKGFR